MGNDDILGDVPSAQKRILVVAHDRDLRESRVLLLEHEGYAVVSVETDDEAMELIQSAAFDLILLGRNSRLPQKGLDQRLRERYPDLLILKIEHVWAAESPFASRIVESFPRDVLAALRDMLAEPSV